MQQQNQPTLDLRGLPGVVTMTRMINAADRLLVHSARHNAAAAIRAQRDLRVDFEAQEQDWRSAHTA